MNRLSELPEAHLPWRTACALFVCLLCKSSLADEVVHVIVEDFWGAPVIRAMTRAVTAETDMKAKLEPDVLDLGSFMYGPSEVLVTPTRPTTRKDVWIYGFPADRLAKAGHVVGQAKVLAVVHKSNPLNTLSRNRLRALLGVGRQGTRMRVYGEAKDSICGRVFRSTVMRTVKNGQTSILPFGNNWLECPDGASVLSHVKADPVSIGFLLCRGPVTDVKLLAINDAGDGHAVRPRADTFMELDYPLAEPLVLYLHPSRPPAGNNYSARGR